MSDEERLQRLEDVVANVRHYLTVSREFYVREENAGRTHAVSPRVAFAMRDVLRSLDRLDKGAEAE